MVDARTTADDSAQSAVHEWSPDGMTGPGERPAQIGRFEILGLLGAGGMGVVYMAHDPSLDRKVAVKVLRERQAEREDRAWREARALARLAHPNVVAIHEIGRHDGRVFLAMELVEGVTCDVWLKSQVRTPAAILEVFVQAGRGLAAAHRAGIVHRDFKPSNVIVGVDGRARVVDFGLARGFGPAAETTAKTTTTGAPGLDTTLTRAGGRPGTPRYMSPEQHEGLPVDARSDQYAFCVALFEALAGQVPGPTGAHPVFTRRPLRRLHRALVRGLQTRPEARYPTMAALCEALEQAMRPRHGPRVGLALGLVGATVAGLLTLRPAAERCDGGAARVEQVWNEARAARFAAAITGTDAAGRATLAGAIEGYLRDWSGTHTAVCEASTRGERSPELHDLQMACLDQRLRDLDAVLALLATRTNPAGEIAGALTQLAPPAGCAEVQALLRRGAPTQERLHPDDAALRQRLAEANALLLVTRVTDAETVALEVAEAAASRSLWILEGEARLLAAKGVAGHGLEHGRARLIEALLHARRHGLEDLATLAAAALLHWSAVRVHDLEDARLFAGLARAGLELTGDDGLLRAEVLQGLAKLHWMQGDLERMLPMLAESRAIWTRHLGAHTAEVAAVLLDIAVVHGRLGRPEEALGPLLEAKSIYEDHYGPLHPGLGRVYFNLSAVHADLGRLDEGFAASRKVIELLAAGGAPPEDIAAAKINLVELLLRAGRAAEALPIAQEIDEVFVRVFGPDAVPVGNSRFTLGETLHALGRVAEAEAPLRESWTILRAALGDAGPETVRARVQYAHMRVARDPAAALALLGDIDTLPAELRGLALLTRAQARLALGDPGAARDDALRARALLPDRSAVDAALHRELDALR